jgi:hypothetical protein
VRSGRYQFDLGRLPGSVAVHDRTRQRANLRTGPLSHERHRRIGEVSPLSDRPRKRDRPTCVGLQYQTSGRESLFMSTACPATKFFILLELQRITVPVRFDHADRLRIVASGHTTFPVDFACPGKFVEVNRDSKAWPAGISILPSRIASFGPSIMSASSGSQG